MNLEHSCDVRGRIVVVSQSGASYSRCPLSLCLLISLLLTGIMSAQPPAPQPPTDQFVEGIYCGICHTNSERAAAMRDAQGRPIAPFDLWRSSAMANSARDPYWCAVVSVEAAATPSRKAEIEEVCSRCHAPMATPFPESRDGQLLEYLERGDQRAFLGLDGVSCTVCHQIAEEGLGTEASFTGHFKIDSARVAYGPHADPSSVPMGRHAGYQAAQGDQILKSALCATCHTLVTETLNPDGTATGHTLHEQSAYLEWRNSIYNNEVDSPAEQAKSCQACHVPVIDQDGQPIRTAIGATPEAVISRRHWPALHSAATRWSVATRCCATAPRQPARTAGLRRQGGL